MGLFIFDMGEVILKEVRTLPSIAESLSIPYGELCRDFARYDAPLMDGYMSPYDYYTHLEAKYQRFIEEDLFVKYFQPKVNSFMLDYVDRLRSAGHRCVIGSNTFEPHWYYIKKMEENPISHFDKAYASHEIHMSKPDTAFWRIICGEEGFKYSDTCFIDDMRENVDAAASLGITVLQYEGDDKNAKADAFFAPFLK